MKTDQQRRRRNQRDRFKRLTETAQEKEARLNKRREKDRAKRAAMARGQRDVIFQASREGNLINNQAKFEESATSPCHHNNIEESTPPPCHCNNIKGSTPSPCHHNNIEQSTPSPCNSIMLLSCNTKNIEEESTSSHYSSSTTKESTP